ncbi:MAG: hypothetical protein JXR56_07145, partial [Candidatus Cloacimonetes bacterium]|nr:hypothetical protein [Candidatus Cloacimonadota bacterium]
NIELDPEKYEDIFIINENMQPYKPNMSSIAWKAFVRPYLLHNNINFEYSETGAGFHSLSSNSIQNDVRKMILSDQINIMNFAMLNAGYNQNTDNLADQKSTTTTFERYFGQLVLQYNDLASLGLSYDTSANTGVNVETDDEEFNQKSVNMSVSADYFVKKMPVAPTRFNLTYTNSNSTDELDDNYEIKLNSINFTMLNKFLTIPLTTKLNYGMTKSENEVLAVTNENTSNFVSLRGEYGFFNGKLVPYADVKLVMLGGDQEQSFNYFNLGAKYNPWKNTRVATNLRLKNYSNSDVDNIDYSEINWNLYISQRF